MNSTKTTASNPAVLSTDGLCTGADEAARTFILGNCLRGCFEGEFSSLERAWDVLSARFLLSYPATEGRHVLMWVRELNKYWLPDTVLCREGVTSTVSVPDDVARECRRSGHIG
jgi:hypothetical protein